MAYLTGRVLGDRYRVDAFLGRGGMADVYKVWDRQRAVSLAMKVLHADLAEDETFLRRFETEARTLERLQHPNIVRFYGLEQVAGPLNAGEPGSIAAILMDFIDGLTLRKEIFLNKAGLAPERILDLLRPVCSALFYAHQMNLAHCDIKPANIMVHRNGTVYLADFGIARMTEASTQTSLEMGTPAYMAPEHLRGDEPSAASDIYSLGVVLFEMVTGGRRPFTGAAAQTEGSTLRKILWEKTHLTAPSPIQYNPAVSPAMEAVIGRCLERRPERRFRTTLELLEALQAAAGGDAGQDELLTPTGLDDYSPTAALSEPLTLGDGTRVGENDSPGSLIPPSAAQMAAVNHPPSRSILRRLGKKAWLGMAAAGMTLALLGLFNLPGRVNAPPIANAARPTVRAGMAVGQIIPTRTALTSPGQPTTEPTQAPSAQPVTALQPQPTRLGGGGGQIAYAFDSGEGTVQVWVMNADRPSDHRVVTHEPGGACQPAWSPDGLRIAYTTPCRGPSIYYASAAIKVITLADGSVTELPLRGGGTASVFDPAWSPDGDTLAYTAAVGEKVQVNAYHFATGQIAVLAANSPKNAQPAWSPDGEHLIYVTTDSLAQHTDALWLMGKNGDSKEVFSNAGAFSDPAWSPDGQQILVSYNDGSNIPVLALISRENPGQGPQPVLGDRYGMAHGVFSPDGLWIAFWTDHVKPVMNREIMLAQAGGQAVIRLTDNVRQDFQPAWRPR